MSPQRFQNFTNLEYFVQSNFGVLVFLSWVSLVRTFLPPSFSVDSRGGSKQCGRLHPQVYAFAVPWVFGDDASLFLADRRWVANFSD